MAHWKHSVKVGDIWNARRAGEITIQQLGQEFANRLEKTPCAAALRDFCESLREVEDIDEFDSIYGDICDWADERHRLWIDTFDPPLATKT